MILYDLTSVRPILIFLLVQWLLMRGDFVPQGTFHHVWEHFCLSKLEDVISTYWVAARDAAKHPPIHRDSPLQWRLSSPKFEKPLFQNNEEYILICGYSFPFTSPFLHLLLQIYSVVSHTTIQREHYLFSYFWPSTSDQMSICAKIICRNHRLPRGQTQLARKLIHTQEILTFFLKHLS